jgi:cytochrome c-type biogenesis protein
MSPSELTLLLAFGAGLLSFLSPCVLPLVPAYLGHLTSAAVVGRVAPAPPRWLAAAHAAAYVLGFGSIFTLLGVTATFVGGPLADHLPTLRIVGGVLVIVLGLNLAGLLPIRLLARTWRPLEAGAAASLARASGSTALAAPLAASGEPGVGVSLGGRLVSGRGGVLTSFGLGVVFGAGWTPCIGLILGGILTVAASSATTLQGGLLLVAYTLGLGVPFILLGLVYDSAPAVVRPLVRHGRAVTLVGGILVATLGVMLVMDWLAWFARLAPGI